MLETPEFRTGAVHTKFVEDQFMLNKIRNPELEKVAAIAATLVAHAKRGRATTLDRGAGRTSAWRMLGRRDAIGSGP